MLIATAVSLQTGDGQNYVGSLEQLDERGVIFRTETGGHEIPLDHVLRLENNNATETDYRATISVRLTDGTELGATTLEIADQAKIGIVGGTVLNLDPRNLSTIRFQQPKAVTPVDKQWDEFIAGEHEGDLLIVRRGTQSLSYLEGAIRGVSEQSVDFVFDGDDFQVGREKIEGLKFLTRRPAKTRANQLVYVSGGSLFQAESIQWGSDSFDVELMCGQKVRLPLSMVKVVDFAASKIVYLSALEPYKLTVTPRVPTSTIGDLTMRLIYRPGINESLSGRRLSLAGDSGGPRQYYDRGLALHSRTELIYRIEDGQYERLQGIAGLDPDLKQQGSVHLLIEGDDQPLLSQDIGPDDTRLPINVSVAGVRRLRILVDYGDKLDTADHLNLCEIRLTP